MANRLYLFVALCAALVLLSLVGHLLADAVWSSPCILTAKSSGLQCHVCHLLDSLALPMLVIILTPLIAICLLSHPVLLCRAWLPAPLAHPPHYAS